MKKERAVKDFFNDNPDFLNTLREGQFGCADRWIEDESIPSGVNDIKVKLDSIDEMNLIKNVSKRKTSRRRFISIAVPITLALTVFFTITNPGQALAETMFRTVGQLFNGSLVIQHDDSGQPLVEEEATHTGSRTFTSIEQAAAYTGNKLIYVKESQVIVEQIVVQSQEAVTIVLTYYKYNGENSFILQQQLFKVDTAHTASIPTEEDYTEFSLFNDSTLYYTRTLEGNSIGIAGWDHTQIQMTSDNMNKKDFTSLFENLMIQEPPAQFE